MSFSKDWLGIEEEQSKEPPQKEMDYMALLRRQQQQQLQALAYSQEMLNRQQQLQLQGRNIQQAANYPLLQQQLLQRQMSTVQPVTQVPQPTAYQQAKMQQMQLIRKQLMEQKGFNPGSISGSAPPLANMTPIMVPGINLSPTIPHAVTSPLVQPSNLGSNMPFDHSDLWTKGYLNFMKNIGKEVTMLPKINGRFLDLKSFMQYVVDLGGFDTVMSENKWSQIAIRLGLKADEYEKAIYLYKTLLLDFERRVYPGLSLLAQNEMRKKMGNISAVRPNFQTGVASPVQTQASPNLQSHSFSDSSKSTPSLAQNPESFTDSSTYPTLSSAAREPNPNIYTPKVRKISSYGGYDDAILDLATTSQKRMLTSFGIILFVIEGDIDIYRIKMSLKSQLDSDCQYAIDSMLILSSQARTAFILERYSDMVDAFFELLSACIQEAFGRFMGNNIKPESRKNFTYYQLYNAEIDSWDEFRKNTEPTLQHRQFMLAERILAMSTILRNFSFDPTNALYLSKHGSFWPVIRSILHICMDNDPHVYSPLTLQEVGILEHRKNLIIIFSNMGSQINIPPECCQLLLNLLEDFLSVSDTIDSYAALEALAKLSLVEENHKCFASASNLKGLIESSANLLPKDGFYLNSSQDIAAQWELASLFIYNISAMDDDRGRFLIMGSPKVMRTVIRISNVGIKAGNDIHADYIGIITLRMLRCIRELASNDSCRSSLCVYENLIFSMMMDVTAMPSSSIEFKTQAGIITSDILKSLEI